MNINELTSGQKYNGINRRFEKRAALLRKLGFTYRVVCEGVAVFTRVRFCKEYNIPATTLQLADKTVWVDKLKMSALW